MTGICETYTKRALTRLSRCNVIDRTYEVVISLAVELKTLNVVGNCVLNVEVWVRDLEDTLHSGCHVYIIMLSHHFPVDLEYADCWLYRDRR